MPAKPKTPASDDAPKSPRKGLKKSDDSSKPQRKGRSDDRPKTQPTKAPNGAKVLPLNDSDQSKSDDATRKESEPGPSGRHVARSRSPTPEGFTRQQYSSDDESEDEREAGRRLRDTASHREKLARERVLDDHVRTPSPGTELDYHEEDDFDLGRSDYESVLKPLEETPPFVPNDQQRLELESAISSIMKGARKKLPDLSGIEGEGSASILDSILAEADADATDDPDKGRPRGYSRWTPSDKLKRVIDALFRKPLSQERHARLEVDNPLPNTDPLLVPKVDALLTSRPDLKAQIAKLPVEADLRNFLRNFVDAAGPLCTLMDEALSSETGYISGERVLQLGVNSLMFLGHATAYVNQKRRQAILELPAIKALSRTVDYKDTPTEGRDLFGPSLKENIRKRKQEATDLKDVLDIDQEPQRKFRKSGFNRFSGSGYRGPRSSFNHSRSFRGESSKAPRSEAFAPRPFFKQPRQPTYGHGYQQPKNYQRPFPSKPG